MIGNKEEFECLMRERRLKYAASGYGFQFAIKVDKEGNPLRKLDKRIMCEIQKIALGSKTAWMVCTATENSGSITDTPLLLTSKIGPYTLYRKVRVYMNEEEKNSWNRLILRVVVGIKKDIRDVSPRKNFYISVGEGDVCAYPGGCD